MKPKELPPDCDAAQREAWTRQVFKYKHRNMRRKLEVSLNFPAQDVIRAYWHPTVDTSTQAFEWALPDLGALRYFCQQRLEWSEEKCNEKIVPVVDALTDGSLTQRRMQFYFDFDSKAAEIRSTRLKEAVGGLTAKSIPTVAASVASVASTAIVTDALTESANLTEAMRPKPNAKSSRRSAESGTQTKKRKTSAHRE